jgi:hypothetical protein
MSPPFRSSAIHRHSLHLDIKEKGRGDEGRLIASKADDELCVVSEPRGALHYCIDLDTVGLFGCGFGVGTTKFGNDNNNSRPVEAKGLLVSLVLLSRGVVDSFIQT